MVQSFDGVDVNKGDGKTKVESRLCGALEVNYQLSIIYVLRFTQYLSYVSVAGHFVQLLPNGEIHHYMEY